MSDEEARVTIKLDYSQLVTALGNKISEIPQRTVDLVDDISDIGDAYLRDEAPVLWGELQNSHVVEVVGPYRRLLYPTAPHAPNVILGSPPHYIGSPVLIKDVGWRYIGMHPGNAPNDYPKRAKDLTESTIQPLLADYVDWLIDL